MRKLLLTAALVGLCACGGHGGPNRLAAVDKALVGTTTAGARSGAALIHLTTSAAHPWIQVSAACTGGGTLDVTVETVPFNPACDSPADGTEVASMRIRPDGAAYGPVTVRVSPTRGQRSWVGAGILAQEVAS